jgi:hypothetical protein
MRHAEKTIRMPLLLKTVEARHGLRWARDAFGLFMKRPLAFTLMLMAFLFAASIAVYVPLLGNVLLVAAAPLLSLGFMVATQSALLGGPVGPSQFIEPLRGDRTKRRSLLLLCLIYGIAAVAIAALAYSMISDSALARIEATAGPEGAPMEDVIAAFSDPSVQTAKWLALLLAGLLSVPFWHAPALVHWGAQSVGQALFSSTLAVWRCRAAFGLYGMLWFGLSVALGLVVMFFGLFVALPLGLLMTTVFYVSLLFTFNDSFGSADLSPPETPHTLP